MSPASPETFYYAGVYGKIKEPAALFIKEDKDLGNDTLREILSSFYKLHGEINDKRGLDCGCGTGWNAVNLARMGAKISAIDINPEARIITLERAKVNNVSLESVDVAPLQQLPYPDAGFDFLSGVCVLESIPRADFENVASELARILKHGGKAIFCEPLGHNPLLEFARDHLPYPRKRRTTEKALLYSDIKQIGKKFNGARLSYFSLTKTVDRFISSQKLSRVLASVDQKLLQRFSRLEKYCRYVVIEYTK